MPTADKDFESLFDQGVPDVSPSSSPGPDPTVGNVADGYSPDTAQGRTGEYKSTMSLAGTQKAEPSSTVADYPVEGVEWSHKNQEEQQYVTDYIEDCIKVFADDYQLKGPIPRWRQTSIISTGYQFPSAG